MNEWTTIFKNNTFEKDRFYFIMNEKIKEKDERMLVDEVVQIQYTLI